MATPERITIDIPQAELDDLRARLHNTRWPVDPGNPDERYGADRAWTEDLVRYWADTFDWRAVEADMNGYEQYRVAVDGIPIHYMRVPGKGPNPMPIVLTHGWPWTFWELRRLADLLSDPAAHGGDPADSFEVIVPSLPGYGFSVPLGTTGVDVRRVGELWTTLMTDVLGFPRFGAQGGDWGAIITSWMGHAHPEQLIGVYMTLPVIPGIVGRREPTPQDYAPDEQWMGERIREAKPLIEAHVAVHRRDPQTFAYAMADSPTGLGAWLWHRRQLWCDGDALEVFGRDYLCTLSSIYWFNTSFASSIRLYAEQFNQRPTLLHDRERIIDAPTGFSVFPKELMFLPRSVAERHTDLRAWNVHERGGHFAPAEQPDAVAGALRAFFRPLR
jgi:pimeloyl-ACP methyl ester carboxylesterase